MNSLTKKQPHLRFKASFKTFLRAYPFVYFGLAAFGGTAYIYLFREAQTILGLGAFFAAGAGLLIFDVIRYYIRAIPEVIITDNEITFFIAQIKRKHLNGMNLVN